MNLTDYEPEINALIDSGYRVVDTIVLDCGETLGLVVECDQGLKQVMLRELFYDTDEYGNRTEFHGVIDIRETPWSRNLRMPH